MRNSTTLRLAVTGMFIMLGGFSSRAGAGAGFDPATGVGWTFVDSVAACPAGDSVAVGHPGRVRIVVRDAPMVGGNPAPRAGVPPESLWVEWSGLAGNVRVNDQPGRANADDSTDANGEARIALPSVSVSGSLRCTLHVSGAIAGSFVVTIAGLDSDLDGRVSNADAVGDLDFDGTIGAADAALATAHSGHSHRHALFGSLVRRTNLCGNCGPYEPNSLGESSLSWSPDGRRLAFTIHTAPWGDCAVFVVPSDPADGDGLVQFSFPDAWVHDYDPSWSPLGDEIVFGRNDNTIWAKGVPGLNPDTTLRLVTRHFDGTVNERGDLTPAISPDGVWVAFSRKSSGPDHWQVWRTPLDGDTTRRVQLTFDAAGDGMYPQWSSDGAWLIYDRVAGGKHSVWRVPSAGGPAQAVLSEGAGLMASTPSFSPDGAILLAGVGPATGAATNVLDAALTNVVLPTTLAVAAFAGFALADADPVLSPRLSPDGTRLALRTNQVFAARRNMSLPPRITAMAGRPLERRRPYLDFNAIPGVALAIPLAATDPEGDAIVAHAYFLRDGMTFDPGTRIFAWTPGPAAAGTVCTVRFAITTASGGSDYALARIRVLTPSEVAPGAARAHFTLARGEPNPFGTRTLLRFELAERGPARLEVFDLSGRRVRLLADGVLPAGPHALEWDGRADDGGESAAGLYVVRLSAGGRTATRKLLRLAIGR